MKLVDVKDILHAEVLTGEDLLDTDVSNACGADLMSDILADTKVNAVLLTGLIHTQILQTATISDFAAIVFVRGKMPADDLIELARKQDMPLLRTHYSLYEACGMLYAAGLRGNGQLLNGLDQQENSNTETQKSVQLSYDIKGNDFNVAGRATEQAKKVLKQLGIDSAVVRRVSIAAYESEMNIVIHAFSGKLTFNITPVSIEIIAEDIGPGIADVEKALREGYSTAPDRIRELGFGAGMGLPNMRRFSDDFNIDSVVGKGTKVTMLIYL
jgi:serine/threonine-protein kinase RsbT